MSNNRAKCWRSNYLLKLANKLIKQKNYNEAMILLTEAVHREPTLSEAMCSKGICLLHMGKYVDATIAVFDRALVLKPAYSTAYYHRALCKHQMAIRRIKLAGNVVTDKDKTALLGAVSDYTECIKLDKFHVESYTNRGSIYGRLRDPRRANADLYKATQCLDQSSELHSLYKELMVEKFDESLGGSGANAWAEMSMVDEKGPTSTTEEEEREGDNGEEEMVEEKRETFEEKKRRDRLVKLRRKSIDGKADLIFIYQNKLKVLHKLGNLKGANSDSEKLDTLVAQQEKK